MKFTLFSVLATLAAVDASAAIDPCQAYPTYDGTPKNILDLIDGGLEPNTLKIRARCKIILQTMGEKSAPAADACLVTGISRKTGKNVAIFTDILRPGNGPQYFEEGIEPSTSEAYRVDAKGVVVNTQGTFGSGMKYFSSRHLNYNVETGILATGTWYFRGEGAAMKNMVHGYDGYALRCVTP